MALKKLLVAMTTVRDGARVRFAAGKTVDLTSAELETLEGLTKATGVLHFRSPVNEVADEGEAVVTRAYIGESTAVDKKNSAQLKAMLVYYGVSFEDKADKKTLAALAADIDTSVPPEGAGDDDDDADNEGEGGDADPDAGL